MSAVYNKICLCVAIYKVTNKATSENGRLSSTALVLIHETTYVEYSHIWALDLLAHT